MSENTKAQEVKADANANANAEPTAEELKAMYDALPELMREAVDKINAEIAEHNKKVESVKAANEKNPTLIKAEIFEQNPDNNKKLATLRKEYEKLSEQLDALTKQAYAVIESDGLMPKELTEAEVTKLKTEVSDSNKSLKDQVSALTQFEAMMPMLKGKILPLISEMKTLRGTGTKSAGTKTGEGPMRLRFKRIEINGVTSDDKGNTVYGEKDGEQKFTFTFASQFLRKQHKGITWVANDLTDKYLEGQDKDNLPEVREFEMPYTFKTENGNETTVVYKVKCFRN
jgi:hypothetical protein